MRRPFTSPSDFISRDILRLSRPSLLERYVNLFLVFLCSSLFHVIVDLLQSVSPEHSGSIPFFMSFVPGIIIEDAVQGVWRMISHSRAQQSSIQNPRPPLWQRTLGFCWVFGWLAITSTWYFTPMIQSTGQDVTMVPFSFSQRLGLVPMASISLGSGMLLMYIFEVEL